VAPGHAGAGGEGIPNAGSIQVIESTRVSHSKNKTQVIGKSTDFFHFDFR
jgi:hypothetical protein